MFPNPAKASSVSPVPTRMSFRGLKRCTRTGPTQSVSSAASGKPSVMSARDQWNVFSK